MAEEALQLKKIQLTLQTMDEALATSSKNLERVMRQYTIDNEHKLKNISTFSSKKITKNKVSESISKIKQQNTDSLKEEENKLVDEYFDKRSELDEKEEEITSLNESVNEEFYSEIDLIQETSAKTCDSFIKKVGNKAKYVIDTSKTFIKNTTVKYANIFSEKFKSFWDNTVEKFFDFMEKKLPFISTLIKITKNIANGFKWMATTFAQTLGYMYGVVKTISKVGYNMLSTIFSTLVAKPTKKFLTFVADVIKTIITSPTGLLALAVSGYFVIKHTSPKILEFMKGLLTPIYTWVEDKVVDFFSSSVIGGGFKRILEENLPLLKASFKDMFSSLLNVETYQKFYENHIFPLTNVSISTLKNYYTLGVEFISNAWTKIKSIFKTLTKNKFWDEVTITWNLIKELSGIDIRGQLQRQEAERLSTFALEDSLKIQSELLIKSYLLNRLSTDLLSERPITSETKEELINTSNDLIDNFLVEKKKMFKFDVTPDINSEDIINKMLQIYEFDRKDLHLETKKFSEQSRSEELYFNTLINELEVLKGATTSIQEISSDYMNTLEDREETLKRLHKNLENINYQISPVISISTVDDIIKKYNLNELEIKNSFEFWLDVVDRSDTSEQAYNNVFQFIKQNKLDETLYKNDMSTIVDSMFKVIESNKRRLNITDKDLEHKKNSFKVLYKLETGGIVTAESLAIIGEGKHSEIILPINKEGVEFIYNSFGELIESKYVKHIEQTEKNKINFIDSYKKIMKKPNKVDKTMFDMKNISSGVIRII